MRIASAEFARISGKMEHGAAFREAGGIGFFSSRALDRESGVSHGFTARYGGVSEAPFDSLNLCFGKTDTRENVEENLRRFARAAEIDYESMVIVNFAHGATVLRVTYSDSGRGVDEAKPLLPECDGIVTDDPRVTLLTNHADCGCFFLYDPVRRACGVAHAGWKGTLAGIGANAVALMAREFSSDPADIIASTGPAICGECYEVDEELGARFIERFGEACVKPGKIGKSLLDCEKAAAVQLIEAGVEPEHITLMEKCTYESPELLFSYRRERRPTGDMAGFIRLK